MPHCSAQVQRRYMSEMIAKRNICIVTFLLRVCKVPVDVNTFLLGKQFFPNIGTPVTGDLRIKGARENQSYPFFIPLALGSAFSIGRKLFTKQERGIEKIIKEREPKLPKQKKESFEKTVERFAHSGCAMDPFLIGKTFEPGNLIFPARRSPRGFQVFWKIARFF